MAQSITVRVDVLGIPEVKDAYDSVRQSLFLQVVKSAAQKGARKTIPAAQSKIQPHNRTGQLKRSIGIKFAGYPGGWTVMLGPRKFFRGSAPSWMSPNATTIDPVKYAHLLEGGRKEVEGKGGKPMPIFVKTLNQTKRLPTKNARIPWRHARRFAKDGAIQYGGQHRGKTFQERARKVPGGWLLFSQGAQAAPAYPWLEPCAGAFGSNITNAIVSEVTVRLPELCARAEARGKSPYRQAA